MIPDPKVGLAVGKFYPPHAGHHYLIDVATQECDKVYVAVCYSGVESIAVEDRIAWLKDRHPKVTFFPVHDDSPVNYSDTTWGLFLDALEAGLSDATWVPIASRWNPYPNVIYSGEAYAPEFAERLLARYTQWNEEESYHWGFKKPELIDVRVLDRNELLISATKFRADPVGNWDMLAPATKAGLCKRVVICGAESSGTTTLAKDLAEHFETTVVPEYGRHYDWAVGKHHTWVSEDFDHIAIEQRRWEEKLARQSHGGLLICDTDEFATAMFHEVYLDGLEAPHIYEYAMQTPADLYIITDHEGVPFEDDGTRYNSGRRDWMTNWFIHKLPGPGKFVKLATGSRGMRLMHAINNIERMLEWDIADPIEKRKGYEYDGLVQA